MTQFNTDDIARRIRGLLAQAESTANQHERRVFMAKAQELMLMHRIDPDRLTDEAARGVEPIERPIEFETRTVMAKARRALLVKLARLNSCDVILLGGASGRVLVWGFPSDIDFVEAMYNSLVLQMLQELDTVPGRKAAAFRNNFAWGFVQEVVGRFTAINTRAGLTGPPSSDEEERGVLVLADRDLKVKDAMAARYGKLKVKSDRGKSRQINYAGMRAGVEAGERATLDPEGRRKLGRTREIS